MRKVIRMIFAGLLCVFLTGSSPAFAQDASHPTTARSQDSSDWGLLGLLGLIGLMGLRKKQRED